jgi:hypothetical protein
MRTGQDQDRDEGDPAAITKLSKDHDPDYPFKQPRRSWAWSRARRFLANEVPEIGLGTSTRSERCQPTRRTGRASMTEPREFADSGRRSSNWLRLSRTWMPRTPDP